MANLNDREIHNRVNHDHHNREVQPTDSSHPGYVTGTNETNVRPGTTPTQTAYRDGYIHGRDADQRRYYEEDLETRDNNNAARGLLLGILLTGAVGLATAAYFLTQRNDPTPTPASQTIVVPKSSPSPQQSPQVRERVIERDRVVPVPQQVPARPAPAPNVNITVPSPASQAPASQSAPAQSSGTTTTPDRSTGTTQSGSTDTTSGSTTGNTTGSGSTGAGDAGTGTTTDTTSPTTNTTNGGSSGQ